MEILQYIGRIFLAFLATVGRLAIFMGSAAVYCVRPPFYPRTVLRHMLEIAYYSLSLVGLTKEVGGFFPAELSGGMQKRVARARAIATDPKIIFFDEPTTGFDPIMADVINDLIIKITREVGATALSITHDMASARKIANRIAMLYEGRIVWAGPTSKIDESGDARVDQFINGHADGPIKMAVRA